ncbi:NdhH [Gossypium australe]|uniref:NdhH n=1 Tax=Gossypium australe TaxID=47621 RepID=A0A5B6VM60_9ROSI|nr:NdhH [Gossypium australe]
MHGVLHLIVTLDGEDVVDYEPILEKWKKLQKTEQLYNIYLMIFSHYVYGSNNRKWAKTIGDIQVPKMDSYIKVIMLELSRVASHLLLLGPFMEDIGAQTPFFYIFRERITQCYEHLESNGIFTKLIIMNVTTNLIGKSSGKNRFISSLFSPNQ